MASASDLGKRGGWWGQDPAAGQDQPGRPDGAPTYAQPHTHRSCALRPRHSAERPSWGGRAIKELQEA